MKEVWIIQDKAGIHIFFSFQNAVKFCENTQYIRVLKKKIRMFR